MKKIIRGMFLIVALWILQSLITMPFSPAVQSIGQPPPSTEVTAQQWFERGKSAMERGDANGAIACFQKCIQKDPDHFDAHLYLGIAYLATGYPDTALLELKEALRIKPNESKAHTYMGLAYMKKGDTDSAIVELKLAIQGDPNNTEAHLALAYIHQEQHNIDGFMNEAKEIARINPNIPIAHILMGEAYAQRGEADSAIIELNKALKLEPNNPIAHYFMGVCYFEKGDLESAANELKESLKFVPGNSSPLKLLGLIYFINGDYSNAEKSFDIALAAVRYTDPYPALFIYICRIKQKGDTEETVRILRTTLANVDSKKTWERALLQYYLGEMPETKLLEMAAQKREQCEGNFYIGTMFWLKGDMEKAAQYWQAAAKTEVTEVVEFYAAKMMLKKKPY